MSSARRIGLPDSLRMRHDPHFVDQLGRPAGSPVGQLIPAEDIQPNPNQPRRSAGDLSELIASIREKGILEPILVRPVGGRYQIIAGERRFRAALEAGLDEIPCIVRRTSDAEMMELALIENLQREDLSAFEEADGLNTLKETYGYTQEEMAQRLGKSRSAVAEVLALSAMPAEVREVCRLADIQSKSLLLQVVRQDDPAKMLALIEQLQQGPGTREEARRLTRKARKAPRGRPRSFVFQYRPRGKGVRLSLQFAKGKPSRDEIIETLRRILDELTAS